jgi:hypothetical protein
VAPNQDVNFLRDPPPTAARPRFPTPIQPETSPMRSGDRSPLGDITSASFQRDQLARKTATIADPEGARWLGRFPLQHGHLPANALQFDGDISETLEETRAKAMRTRTNGRLTLLEWQGSPVRHRGRKLLNCPVAKLRQSGVAYANGFQSAHLAVGLALEYWTTLHLVIDN